MSDIAMLVAEEYERRVRISRNRVGAEKQEIDLVSGVAVLAQKVRSKFGQQRSMELLKLLALEPKTQIGVAAFNGTTSRAVVALMTVLARIRIFMIATSTFISELK
ncbi:hypothetical protein PTKIN_Ptkin08bG0152400 [Pterospermum kingtungense]